MYPNLFYRFKHLIYYILNSVFFCLKIVVNVGMSLNRGKKLLKSLVQNG